MNIIKKYFHNRKINRQIIKLDLELMERLSMMNNMKRFIEEEECFEKSLNSRFNIQTIAYKNIITTIQHLRTQIIK